MKKRAVRSLRAARKTGASLMLAPTVAALRVPLLAAEAMESNPWRVETSRAFTEKMAAACEGAVAAQMSIAAAGWRFWPELLSGKVPSLLSGEALEQATHAALRPSGKAVKANYRRLSR